MKLNKTLLKHIKHLLSSKDLETNACALLAVFVLLNTTGFTKAINENAAPDTTTKQSTDELNSCTETIEEAIINAMAQVKNVTFGDCIIEPTNEEKEQYILEKENLTKKQFDEVVCTVLGEAKANSYDDAYGVINTMYNRKTSKTWVNYINYIMGEGTGDSLYYQCIAPKQFTAYKGKYYREFLSDEEGRKELPGYQAVIDFLYEGEIKHNFLSFLSAKYKNKNRTTLVEGGNCYFNEMTEEDRIQPQENTEKEIVKVLK